MQRAMPGTFICDWAKEEFMLDIIKNSNRLLSITKWVN